MFLSADIFELLATFTIGIVCSFIGSIAGSGGLISIPFLMLIGLPPLNAIATNKFGAVGLSIGAMINFWRKKKINWHYVLPFSVIAIAGGVIGAKLLLEINEALLRRIIAIIMLGMLPLLLMKREVGIESRRVSPRLKVLGYFLYFLCMIFGGFFGGGGVTIVFYMLIFCFGFTVLEANATNIIPWFFVSLSSAVVYLVNGVVDIALGISLFLGMLIGAYIGSRVAIRRGDGWVKTFFTIVVVAASIKLLFD